MDKNNFDNKLIQNLLEEINRLNTQLQDLETYKDELSEEEKESIRKDTLEQLINNTKILEKMKTGDITTKSAVESAWEKINSILFDNYHVKDLLNSYLVTQSNFLREKLNRVIGDYRLNKIQINDYESSVSQLLEALNKVTSLNEEEKKLYDVIKSKVMGKYQKDEGIDKSKIEKNLMNK